MNQIFFVLFVLALCAATAVVVRNIESRSRRKLQRVPVPASSPAPHRRRRLGDR